MMALTLAAVFSRMKQKSPHFARDQITFYTLMVAWLRNRRKEPPTVEELIRNQQIAQMKQENARKLAEKEGKFISSEKVQICFLGWTWFKFSPCRGSCGACRKRRPSPNRKCWLGNPPFERSCPASASLSLCAARGPPRHSFLPFHFIDARQSHFGEIVFYNNKLHTFIII